MDLSTVTRWSEARPHLDALRTTVMDDIRPLLATPGSAPFAICREVFSYVDYLGALFSGTLEVRARFTCAMRNLLSQVDAHYERRAEELYQMYRCGTVHQFKPKTLINPAGQTLSWLNYRGPRTVGLLDIPGFRAPVTHLVPVVDTANSHALLPVSSTCLIEDLERAIELFAGDPNEAARVSAWNAAAARFVQAAPLSFTL
jgi:hypothetical protein